MPNAFLRQSIARLMRGEDLSRADAGFLLEALLDPEATDGQIAATLIALKIKGETVDELAGLAEAMRNRASRIASHHERFIDTAGTGSSCAKTFNVSTAAAFVIAGAGLPVAKHGNRAASSLCGSADVLSALGINVSSPIDCSQTSLNDTGICFMFAPLYHGATARVAAIRRELGVQTTFNLLGPLTNPARAPRQIIGVWNRDLLERMARALALIGTERAWIVHGADGLDEITIAGKTFVAEALNGGVKQFELHPEDFGLKIAALDRLRGGSAADNAKIIRDVLAGTRRDEARDLVVVNAAAALFVGGEASNLADAVEMARNSIDSGAAMTKLDQLIQATNQN